jgi:hypothetical protein
MVGTTLPLIVSDLLRMMIFLVTSTIPVVLLMLSRRRRGRRVVHVVAVNVGRRQLLLSASVGRRVMIVLAPLLGTTGDGTGAIVLVTLHRSGTLPLASVLLGVLAAAPSWSLVGFFRGSMVPRIPVQPMKVKQMIFTSIVAVPEEKLN